MMAKHTPGPWWWGRDEKHQSAHNLNSRSRPDVEIAIGGPSGYWLLEGICGNVRARTKADARLIAAAPDLLDACKDALEPANELSSLTKHKIKKAIAKATKA